MGDRRHTRPHSPSLFNPARASAPSINYGKYSDLHAIPTRRDVFASPRNSGDRVDSTGPVVTHYKIKPDAPIPRSEPRERSHSRRSTLDSTSRPIIVTPTTRYPVVHHGEHGAPSSPVHDPYRSSQEGDVYTVPASSGRRGDYRRGQYSLTMDNADINRQDRESGHDKLLRVGSGRDGVIYPRSRPIHPDTLVRHPDTVANDYGDNGYGYTNPRDLVQYDLDLDKAPRRRPRHDSFESSRSGRPSSLSGYPDMARSYDSRERERERGPPPTTRGFDKLPQRNPIYDAPGMHMPMPDEHLSAFGAPAYVSDPPSRRNSHRQQVSVYNEESDRRKRPTDDYNLSEDDLRERRPRRKETFDEGIETRGFGIRAEAPPAPRPERIERNEKADIERIGKIDREEKIDYDRRNDHGERPERRHGRDAVAAGLSVAGAALGLNAVKASRDDEKDGRDEHRSEHRRRRDSDEEHRRRREPREEEVIVDLTGRDPKERSAPRDERPPREDRDVDSHRREPKESVSTKDQPPDTVDLSGRNPVEKPVYRDDINYRGPAQEMAERRKPHSDRSPKVSPPGSRQDSQGSSTHGEPASYRSRRDKARDGDFNVSSPTTFNSKDAMDLRSLRDELNKQEATAPPIPAKEPIRESDRLPREANDLPSREPSRLSREIADRPSRESTTERFDPRDARDLASIRAELSSRDDRGRRSDSDHSQERKNPRLVSPPRDDKKGDDRPVKGILKPGRQKFPEDPSPIREGVAPLKDAKKDGVPPDARWTKISRKLVNPEALEKGRERYEAREEFVIVLRVLSKEEVQAYATETQNIRAAREAEEDERHVKDDRRRRRRERHERHRGERHRREDREDEGDYDHEHRRRRREKDSHSESDTSEDERKMIENPRSSRESTSLREDPERAGTYSNYIRNPPR